MAYLPPNAGRMNVTLGGNTAGAMATVSTGSLGIHGGNNVTLSQNGNNVTISGANALTSQSNQALSGSNGSFTFQTATFGNSNGVSFYTTNGSVVASHNALTSQSNQAFSAAGGSSVFQTLSFSDGNGVSFTNTNGQVGAFVATTYAGSNHSHGNPTLNLTNLSGTTASASNGLTLSLSAAAPGAGAAISAAGASASNGTVVFSNSNGIGFGMNGSTVTASHNGLTSQSNQALAGSNGTITFQTGNFINSNGVSFLTTVSNGSNVMAGSVATTYAASNHSHGNPTLALTNLSGTTASASNGLTLSLSAAAPGGGGGVALYDGANSISSGTARLSAQGALTASINGQTLSLSVPSVSSLSATGAVSVSSNAGTISIGAPYFNGIVSTAGSTIGNTGTIGSQTRMILAGGQNIALSQATAAGAATVTISGRKRIGSTVSSATPSIDISLYDMYKITALAANITSFSYSGTPVDGQTLWVIIINNATSHTIAWGASFEASTVTLPTSVGSNARIDVGFIWTGSIWRCVAVA